MSDDPFLDGDVFRSLAEASAAITFIYQGERNLYANPAAEALTGYSREELRELKFWDIIHPDSQEVTRQRGLARQRGEEVPSTYEVKILTRSGESRWLDFTGVVVDLAGAPAVLGTAFDITDRVRYREALKASEDQYRRLVDNAIVGVMRTKVTGEILFANRAMIRMFGFESLEELRREGIQARYEDPAERERLLECLRRDGRVEQFEVRFLQPGGPPVTIEASIVLDGDELSGVVVDVSERRRLQVEALRAQKLDSLSLLAGGLAHDFNNFLSTILSNVTVARRLYERGEDPRGCCDEAEAAVLRARAITDQLLTVAQGTEPRPRPVDLLPVLQQAVDFALRGSGVVLEWRPHVDRLYVEVDVAQIEQVIHNLAINAVQAMPGGGTLVVEADLVEDRKQRAKVVFHDRGPGVPVENQERIFDPYFTTKPTGTGLGLAAARAILGIHGGSIQVAPAPEGARFVVDLPAAESLGPDEPGPAPSGDARPEERPDVRTTPLSVLYMDDDDGVRRSTTHLLEELGCQVSSVAHGEAALGALADAEARGLQVDLVILDVTVSGGLGGMEVLERLRAAGSTVRVVMTTGYAGEPVLRRMQELGGASLLRKPFTLQDLARCLEGPSPGTG